MYSRKLPFCIIAASVVSVLAMIPAITFAATTWYVDCQAGNDANSGTSPTAAKLDLYGVGSAIGAAQAASAGDTILIKRGTVCNFPQSQTINKDVHITSSASYYQTSPSDAWPILSDYGVWTSGWVNKGSNMWEHTLSWSGAASPANYVRFGALGISNAGPDQATTGTLTAPKDYYYYGGTSVSDPPYVEVYAPSDPAVYYGNVYYATSTILNFTNFGNGVAVSSGMQVDYLTFENTDVGIGVYPLDTSFASGTIQDIQCIDVHRCVFVEGNGASGDTLANFNLQNSTITGASGPGVQYSGVDRMVNDKIRFMTITNTGASESYGGIYTYGVNGNHVAGDTTYNDFQITDNTLTDCQTGNLFSGDGACIENDTGSLSLLATRNTISNSYECYHSNSGGVSGYTPPANRGIYFVDNMCNGTDKLGSASDSAGQGKGLVYILNNTLLNGTVDSFAPQVPNRDALFNVENSNAVGIYVRNNFIQLSPSYVGTAYGVVAVSAMVDGTNMFESNNAYSPNLTANYVSAGGYPRTATNPQSTTAASLIDLGTTTPFTFTDYYGNQIYGLPDIGAVEYQPPYHMGVNLIDTSGGVRVYRDGSYYYSAATSSGATMANFSITPYLGFPTGNYSEFLNLSFQQWHTSGDYVKKWTESGPSYGIDATTTTHTIGGFAPNANYSLLVDGLPYGGLQTSNSQGSLSFTYNGGYSTHTFEIDPQNSNPLKSSLLEFLGGLIFRGGTLWR